MPTVSLRGEGIRLSGQEGHERWRAGNLQRGNANLGGICVRGRGVGEHPGRPKHWPVLVAAAAVLTVRVEAEAHPPAQPHQLHCQCAPLGCRQATDSSRAAAGSPASFSAAAAQACLRSNPRQSPEKAQIQCRPCFQIAILMQVMLIINS